jgi:flagellar basal body-associated protein FliL
MITDNDKESKALIFIIIMMIIMMMTMIIVTIMITFMKQDTDDDDEDDDNDDDEEEVPRVSTTESAREHVFPILISELVKESILDTFQGIYIYIYI